MKDQTLTFAAICQAAYLVQQVSRTGQIDEHEFTVLLNSIINTSPENTLAVYGGELANLKQGLVLLIRLTVELGNSWVIGVAAKSGIGVGLTTIFGLNFKFAVSSIILIAPAN